VDPSQSHRVSGDERRIKAEIISFLREGDNMRGDSKTTAQSAFDAIVQETRQALRGNQSFIPGMTPLALTGAFASTKGSRAAQSLLDGRRRRTNAVDQFLTTIRAA
jgi:hypothetical protein